MKKHIIILLLVYVLIALIPCGIAAASDVEEARYHGVVRANNNGDSAASGVSCNFSSNVSVLLNANYAASISDIVLQLNGADVAFQPGYDGNPWAFWVGSINPTTYLDFVLFMGGATGGKIVWFPAAAGGSVADSATLELGDNFTLSYSGRIDTANSYLLDFIRANSDYAIIPDDDAFSFTDGAGNDQPFSIVADINLDDATNSGILNKSLAAGNNREWQFNVNGSDYLQLVTYKPDGSGYVGRRTNAITAYEGRMVRVAATYDGSEVVGGFNVYIEGVAADAADVAFGTYTGMVNGASDVNVGAKDDGGDLLLDGKVASVIVYDVELTPAQVREGHTGDIVAYYPLNEGAGLPQDISGNGHDITTNLAEWQPHTGENIMGKLGAFSIKAGNNAITANITGGAAVTTAAISGEYDLEVTANTTHLKLYLDGLLKDSAEIGAAVPNTGNPYIIGGANTPYIESISIDVGGTPVAAWAWQYAETWPDSINGIVLTPSYRTTSSDPDVSADLHSFAPVDLSEVDTYTLTTEYSILSGDISPPTGMYTGGTHTYFPGGDAVDELLEEGGIPEAAWWMPFIFIGICVISFIVYGATTSTRGANGRIMEGYIDGSLLAMAVVIEGLLVAFGKMGVIEYWPSYLFPIAALAIIMQRKHFSW